jgi:antitoxin FitA
MIAWLVQCNHLRHLGGFAIMPSVTVRNVPEAVHRALRVRAAQHGRSAEAEIRDILEQAVKPAQRVRLGDELAALGRKVGLTPQDFEALEQVRDTTPAEPLRFE